MDVLLFASRHEATSLDPGFRRDDVSVKLESKSKSKSKSLDPRLRGDDDLLAPPLRGDLQIVT